MRKINILLSIVLIVIALVGCETEGSNKRDVYKVRISCDTVDDSTLTIYLKKFAEEAEKKSDGKLKFEIYTNGSLYKGVAGLEATQAGNLEMCLCALSNYGELSPKIFVLSLPFVLPTNQAVFDAYSGKLGEMAIEDMNDYNLDLLSYFVYGGTDISSNKEIRVPSDIKGLKMRVFGLANSSYMEACGGAPTFMSGGEVTQALSTGLIDGALTGAESMVERKYYEFQSNLCAVGFERADQMVVMNHEWWETLPDELKKVITETMNSVSQEEWNVAVEKEKTCRTELEKMGMNVYYPSQEEMSLWYKAAEPVYDEFRKTLGDDFVDRAIEFRDSY